MDFTFILFDEIEKASDTLWSLLLGILDKGRLTLGDNTEVDMTRTVIYMTGNIGADRIDKLFAGGIGFGDPRGATADPDFDHQIYATVLDAARRKFSPEFMNRIDSVVVFRNLNEEHVRRILDIELAQLQRRIMQAAGDVKFSFELSDAGKGFLLAEGVDRKYGARHIKRAIERYLVYPLANLVATGQLRYGDHLHVDLGADGALSFRKGAPRLRIVGEAVPVA